MTTQTLPRSQTHTQQDAPQKRLFTRKEYHAMGRAGIFAPNERVELLEGEIIAMSPMGDRHSSCITRVNRVFAGLNIANRAIVSIQSPVVTSSTSEPEPDIALLAFRDDLYDFGKPRPHDVLLLIEVSDSSLEYDREVKLPYYASLGIPETWIANLQDDRIEAYTDPSPEGYLASRIYRPGGTISPTAFPDLQILVNDIIPARPNPESDTQDGDDNDNSEQ
ncbi:MAG: Uma2 family endonuclease [Dehalococcoidia bacterium]|nr:Uma2 family endonuclease [Dehalococcoidia bacterium]